MQFGPFDASITEPYRFEHGPTRSFEYLVLSFELRIRLLAETEGNWPIIEQAKPLIHRINTD